MAVTITPIYTAGPDTRVVDVTMSGDGDHPIEIAHGLGAAPVEITLTPRSADGAEAGWFVQSADATNVTIELGSGEFGNPAVALRVVMKRPHSLGR